MSWMTIAQNVAAQVQGPLAVPLAVLALCLAGYEMMFKKNPHAAGYALGGAGIVFASTWAIQTFMGGA